MAQPERAITCEGCGDAFDESELIGGLCQDCREEQIDEMLDISDEEDEESEDLEEAEDGA